MKILYPGCRCRIVGPMALPKLRRRECTVLGRSPIRPEQNCWELAIDGVAQPMTGPWYAPEEDLEPITPHFDFTREQAEQDRPVTA